MIISNLTYNYKKDIFAATAKYIFYCLHPLIKIQAKKTQFPVLKNLFEILLIDFLCSFKLFAYIIFKFFC